MTSDWLKIWQKQLKAKADKFRCAWPVSSYCNNRYNVRLANRRSPGVSPSLDFFYPFFGSKQPGIHVFG